MEIATIIDQTSEVDCVLSADPEASSPRRLRLYYRSPSAYVDDLKMSAYADGHEDGKRRNRRKRGEQ